MLIKEFAIASGSETGEVVEIRFMEGHMDSIVLDLTEGLQRFNGNRAVFKKLLMRFLEINAHFEENAERVVKSGDFEEMALFFHTIKGASGNLAAKALYERADRLEMLSRSGDLDAIRESLSSLLSDFTELRQAILALEASH